MVKVCDDYPRTLSGAVDVDSWLARLKTHVAITDDRAFRRAFNEVTKAAETPGKGTVWSEQQGLSLIGMQMADLLARLKLDQDTLIAAILYRAVRENRLSLERVNTLFGASVGALVKGVIGMAVISAMLRPEGSAVADQQKQLEKMRSMLVSIVDDVRVALIKLAERTCAIRAVKNADGQRQQRVAWEVFEIYAPLAQRLGIGYIKWELEDLAFRYLRPRDYKKVASLLDGRRLDRERDIAQIVERIGDALNAEGIEADISGRAKHIYSIWRKMQRKGVEFHDLYDIRAIRIHVEGMQACYAALGVVHSLWNHIPQEFDDYIATPKENGYQSLHTAVAGTDGKTLEVQIRTRAMHEEAELGVCAHWKYKQDSHNGKSDSYEAKLNWLRQVIDWQDEIGQGMEGFACQWRLDVEPDRVYVFTKDGHVIDLPMGATAVDFAYRVHTDVGNACRGAKIGGRIVPLNSALKTGDQVEILTAANATPSRDWLRPALGFIATSRARAKIISWFRQQGRKSNVEAGRTMVEAELKRLDLEELTATELANCMKLQDDEELFARVGAGDIRILQVVQAAQRLVDRSARKEGFELRIRPESLRNDASDVLIEGVGNLLTQLAKCCRPVPGDPIVGYITVGQGVSVHRADCSNALYLRDQGPERVIMVSWREDGPPEATYPVRIVIEAYDRPCLLRDITALIANEKINVTDMVSHRGGRENISHIALVIEISSLDKLGRMLAKLNQLPNILEARRDRSGLKQQNVV